MKTITEKSIDFLINKYLQEDAGVVPREEVADYELDEELELLHDEDEEEVNEGMNIMAFSPEIRESFKRMVQAFMKRGMSHADAERVAFNRIKGQALV
jgi:hypothetical protein